MLIVYFRLFAQTVNNNEAMPFVAMAVDNSLQFELSISRGGSLLRWVF